MHNLCGSVSGLRIFLHMSQFGAFAKLRCFPLKYSSLSGAPRPRTPRCSIGQRRIPNSDAEAACRGDDAARGSPEGINERDAGGFLLGGVGQEAATWLGRVDRHQAQTWCRHVPYDSRQCKAV